MKRSLLVLMVLLLGVAGLANAQKKRTAIRAAASKTVVEVMYFHGKQRCPTCIAIGNFSKEVVTKDFANQVKAGQVRFKEIDISTPQGEKIADNYRVTWSSLFVNQWKNGKESRNDMTRFAFENARSNTPAFKSGLKNKISKLLK
jgi:uncharacterized alpha/beta hydrolase family protein